MKHGISVVIPAYNECRLIGDTVRAARSIPGVAEVVVIDDGSEDDTGAIARAAGGEVLTLPRNGGKGRALTLGICCASNDIILCLDGDLGKTATQGSRLLAPLLAGEADMTIARFPPMPYRAGFGLALGLARWGTWLLTGLMLEAPLSGQRGFTRAALQSLHPLLPGFGVEVGFNVRAVRSGLRIKEIPVVMKHRATGKNIAGFRHRAKQFWHILIALIHLLRKG